MLRWCICSCDNATRLGSFSWIQTVQHTCVGFSEAKKFVDLLLLLQNVSSFSYGCKKSDFNFLKVLLVVWFSGKIPEETKSRSLGKYFSSWGIGVHDFLRNKISPDISIQYVETCKSRVHMYVCLKLIYSYPQKGYFSLINSWMQQDVHLGPAYIIMLMMYAQSGLWWTRTYGSCSIKSTDNGSQYLGYTLSTQKALKCHVRQKSAWNQRCDLHFTNMTQINNCWRKW